MELQQLAFAVNEVNWARRSEWRASQSTLDVNELAPSGLDRIVLIQKPVREDSARRVVVAVLQNILQEGVLVRHHGAPFLPGAGESILTCSSIE
jgi:hypothetical protein